MTAPSPEIARDDSAPAKARLVGVNDAPKRRWPPRRTMAFVVVCSLLLWALVGLALSLAL